MRQRSIGAGQQKNAIRLTDAMMRPGGTGAVAAIDHNIVQRLEGIKPFRPVVRCCHIEHRGFRPHGDERLGQALRKWFVPKVILKRNDGDCLGRRVRGLAEGFLHMTHEDAHEIEHDVGMSRHERLEPFAAYPQKLGIPHGDEFGGMGLARDKRHFPNGLSRRDMSNEAPLALPGLDKGPERPGDDQKQGAVVLAVSRQ